MLETILLLIIFCIDLLLVCITYSINKIKIPFKSGLIISSVCCISLIISSIFSNLIFNNMNSILCNIICFLTLLILGLYNIFSDKIKNVLSKNHNKLFQIYVDETKADLNNSKNLNRIEALILSIILSLDSFVGGISIDFTKNNLFFVVFLFFFINIIFIILGNIIGNSVSKYINFNTSYICGILLIIIGIFKLI